MFSKQFFLLLALLLSLNLQIIYSQEEDTELYEQDEPIDEKEKHHELGVMLNFWASNLGGNGGLALQYATVSETDWAYGPSFRYERAWFNLNGISGGVSVFGPGFFVHKRIWNYVYIGSDFELLYSPFIQGVFWGQKKWVPIMLLGGGFSRKITDGFRLNAGVMYDVIDNPSSPFRNSYFMRKENGALIPVVYRVSFLFDL